MMDDKPEKPPGTLKNGRRVCPKCGRKGVGYAAHAHAFGWKDYGRASCRYCHASFRVGRAAAAMAKETE